MPEREAVLVAGEAKRHGGASGARYVDVHGLFGKRDAEGRGPLLARRLFIGLGQRARNAVEVCPARDGEAALREPDFGVDMNGGRARELFEEGLGDINAEEVLEFGRRRLGIDAERHDAVLRFGGDLDGLAAGTRAREGRGRDDALFRDVQAPIDARDRRQVEAVVEGGVADVRIDVDAQVSDDVAGKGNMKVHAHVGGARTFAFGERGGEDVVEHPALIEIAEHAAEVSLGAARDLQIGVRVGLHADDDVACLEIVRGCAPAADFEAVSDEGEVRVDVVENGPTRGGLPAAVGLPDVRGEEVEPAARHVGLDRKVSVVLVLAVPGKVLKRSLHDEGAVGAAAAENAGL